MRIVSLLPSATEILFAVGAGDHVVGVTVECDFPPEARTRRVVSTTTLAEGLSPAEIDAAVATAVARGDDLYRLDSGALAEIDPDLVVTQDLCAVCAVDVSTVDDALAHLGCRGAVLTVDPHSLDEVLASIVTIGEAVGRPAEASSLVTSLHRRLDDVRSQVAGRSRPRVAVLEWTDPPWAPGHWVPEMVEIAGGECVLGAAGERSARITWDDVRAAAPDVILVA
ncbi:MAG: ABC transporter substrate-binding protein, partial [Dermatophilaceae bacterium]